MFRLVSILTLLLCGSAISQQQKIQLPQDPRLWFNVKPIALEALKGKGVVLYFFEEG